MTVWVNKLRAAAINYATLDYCVHNESGAIFLACDIK